MKGNRRAFTLVELMVVVVILALLGILALNVYKRYTLKAKSSEALTLLAHIKAKEEAYHAEYYRYAHMPSFHPTEIRRDEKVPMAPLPPEWHQLGVQTQGWVLFQYNAVSDQGDVNNAPPGGHALYGLTPGQSWFIATARAKFDSDSEPDTTFEVVNNRDSVWKVDKFGNRGP